MESDLHDSLRRRGFLVLRDRVAIGFVVREPTGRQWIPFSFNTERTVTQLDPVTTRYQAEKAIKASWGYR